MEPSKLIESIIESNFHVVRPTVILHSTIKGDIFINKGGSLLEMRDSTVNDIHGLDEKEKIRLIVEDGNVIHTCMRKARLRAASKLFVCVEESAEIDYDLPTLMVEQGEVLSKGMARRLIRQGAVKIKIGKGREFKVAPHIGPHDGLGRSEEPAPRKAPLTEPKGSGEPPNPTHLEEPSPLYTELKVANQECEALRGYLRAASASLQTYAKLTNELRGLRVDLCHRLFEKVPEEDR